ncbi:MAG: hypothetical protein ABR530_01955 [Pyrinomonadaceae bacterium]
MTQQNGGPRDTEHQGQNAGRSHRDDVETQGAGQTLGEGQAMTESEAAGPRDKASDRDDDAGNENATKPQSETTADNDAEGTSTERLEQMSHADGSDPSGTEF